MAKQKGGGERSKKKKTATSKKKRTRLVTREHANGYGSSAYSARWNRDQSLKRGGKVRKRERATAAGDRKRGNARDSGRNASRPSAWRSEKERRGNKSGKNESIGGVFHDAPLEALQVGSAIGGVRLI